MRVDCCAGADFPPSAAAWSVLCSMAYNGKGSCVILNGAELPRAAEQLQKLAGLQLLLPCSVGCLCRLAYDGKGNYVVPNEAELSEAVEALGGYEAGLYAEAWVPYVKVRLQQAHQGLGSCMYGAELGC